jgi:hypothetical protein
MQVTAPVRDPTHHRDPDRDFMLRYACDGFDAI